MGDRTQHVELGADTVATVTLSTNFQSVEVLHTGKDGAGAAVTDDVFVRVDGTADPAVDADGSTRVRPGEAIELKSRGNGTTVVRLISAGTPMVDVEGI